MAKRRGRSNTKHKTELRKREILCTVCLQKGCKFFGKLAAQGVCHDKLTRVADTYAKGVMQQGYDFVESYRKLRSVNHWNTLEKWAKFLEGQVACIWASSIFTLDELIRLRAENAKLQVALGKWKTPANKKWDGKLKGREYF